MTGLSVYVDKRITLGAFKKELEKHIGTTSENFKVNGFAFDIFLCLLHVYVISVTVNQIHVETSGCLLWCYFSVGLLSSDNCPTNV